MRIERAIVGVTTLGPGKRLALWTNGCSRHCKGCVSERLQTPNPSTEVDVAAFLDDYDFAAIDGVTISGGEPFDQPEGLKQCVEFIQEKGVDDILIYTGYLLKELRAKGDPNIDYVLAHVCAIVDGPYVEELNDDTGNLYGSSNQTLHLFNPKYEADYAAYQKGERSMQEFHIGHYLVGVGIPTREYIKEFERR